MRGNVTLMGADFSGHWAVSADCATLQDPGTSRNYDVLVQQAISTASGLRFARRSACGIPAYIWTGGRLSRAFDEIDYLLNGIYNLICMHIWRR